MIKHPFVARDQYGQTYFIYSEYPRKWLLNYFGRQHVDKIYDDLKGQHHIGYVIAGKWLTIFRINEWKE